MITTTDDEADTVATTGPPAWVPVALIAVTLVLWASAFVAIRHLADDFSPGALALGRLAVGAVVLTAFALPRGRPRPTARQWRSIVAIGVLWYAVYMVTLNAGEHRVDSGTSAMLIQVSPVVVAVLAAAFLGERFTARLGTGLALAFGGVVVIAVSQTRHTGAGGAGGEAIGVALILLAAVVYAVAIVLQKPLMASLSGLHVTWLACTVGAVCCLPFAGSLVHGVRTAPASSTAWVVFLGVFPTAVAFTTYAVALRHMRASSLSVTTYLVPVITIVLAWLFLGEVPPPLAYVGGVLTLIGVGVARSTGRRRDRLRVTGLDRSAAARDGTHA